MTRLDMTTARRNHWTNQQHWQDETGTIVTAGQLIDANSEYFRTHHVPLCDQPLGTSIHDGAGFRWTRIANGGGR
jgi:hypothetical protein